jgi:hypothetical protein
MLVGVAGMMVKQFSLFFFAILQPKNEQQIKNYREEMLIRLAMTIAMESTICAANGPISTKMDANW